MDDSDLSDRLRRAARPADPLLPDTVVSGAPGRRAPRTVDGARVARTALGGAGALGLVTVGALAVSAALAPTAPLFTAAAGSSGARTEASGLAADSKMIAGPWIDYHYTAGAGLPTGSGRGHVQQLVRDDDPVGTLRHLAEVFGVAGEPEQPDYSDPSYPTWTVGPQDGSAPNVTLTDAGTGSWWFNDPAAYPEPVCEPAPEPVVVGGDAVTDQVCTVPDVGPNPLTEDVVRVQASELFGRVGLPTDPATVRVTVDDWGSSATAGLVVDGVETAVEWSVGWGPTGELAWAAGNTVHAVDRGEFDTISASAAVDRLSDGRWWGAPGAEYAGGGMIAFARDAATDVAGPDAGESEPPAGDSADPAEPADPDATPSAEPTGEPSEPPTAEPTAEPSATPLPDPSGEPSPDPVATPEVVTLALDEAHATLLLMWDANGDAWLVPGWVYPHPDGWWLATASVVDGVIALPAPFDGEAVPFVE
ncbi:MAG: hypothetical protein J0G30_05215 [Actinomycetales bacterium]|nr:hypothetical protein [Actinomycetales bacterium]